jgi:hypothetical protein
VWGVFGIYVGYVVVLSLLTVGGFYDYVLLVVAVPVKGVVFSTGSCTVIDLYSEYYCSKRKQKTVHSQTNKQTIKQTNKQTIKKKHTQLSDPISFLIKSCDNTMLYYMTFEFSKLIVNGTNHKMPTQINLFFIQKKLVELTRLLLLPIQVKQRSNLKNQ